MTTATSIINDKLRDNKNIINWWFDKLYDNGLEIGVMFKNGFIREYAIKDYRNIKELNNLILTIVVNGVENE